MLAGDAASWRELPDEELLVPPTDVTNILVDPLLELLPTHEMTWPNFESLLKRVAREVEGLRAVRLYGVPGQAQDGIDLVGINPAGENEWLCQPHLAPPTTLIWPHLGCRCSGGA
jgi:hypothetical protein